VIGLYRVGSIVLFDAFELGDWDEPKIQPVDEQSTTGLARIEPAFHIRQSKDLKR
jgi:hypothetical protein